MAACGSGSCAGQQGRSPSPSSQEVPLDSAALEGLRNLPCFLLPVPQPPREQPGHTHHDTLTLSHFTERRAFPGACPWTQLAAQVTRAGRTYLCRPPPRPGGRWLPTPAKWLAAHSPKCPGSPWHPGAGQRRPLPSACLQAEGKEREEEKEAVTVEKMQTHHARPSSVSEETCGRFMAK